MFVLKLCLMVMILPVVTSCWWGRIWSRSARPRSSTGLWPGSTRSSRYRTAHTSGAPAGPRRAHWTRTAVAVEEKDFHYISRDSTNLLLLLMKSHRSLRNMVNVYSRIRLNSRMFSLLPICFVVSFLLVIDNNVRIYIMTGTESFILPS